MLILLIIVVHHYIIYIQTYIYYDNCQYINNQANYESLIEVQAIGDEGEFITICLGI